jgi:large subunit ribosomal protein L13e
LSKPKKADSKPEELKLATQLKDDILPFQSKSTRTVKARQITDEERKFSSFSMLRKVRADTAMWGIREKKAKEKAEAEKNK